MKNRFLWKKLLDISIIINNSSSNLLHMNIIVTSE